MRHYLCAACLCAAIFWPAAPAPLPALGVKAHYRLIQVVGSETLQEKIDDASAAGYRLVCIANTPSGSTAVVLKAAGDEGGVYQYALRDLKVAPASIKELPQVLNNTGAKGFRLQAVLSPLPYRLRFNVPPAVVVMEKAPGTVVAREYEVLKGGLDGFKKDKLAALWGDGYRLNQTAWILASLLIFERNREGGAALPAPSPGSANTVPYRFLVSRWSPVLVPAKEIGKVAQEGYRVVDVFYFDSFRAMAAAQAPAAPPGLYQYRILKPEGRQDVGEDELNKAGAEGYRLVRLRTVFASMLMEKTPGESGKFQYRMLNAPRLGEMADQLEQSAEDGFEVATLRPLMDGITVILERPLGAAAP